VRDAGSVWNRNVVVMSLAVFFARRGRRVVEELSAKYLERSARARGIGCTHGARFSRCIYQYPGGAISDRIGTRRA